MKVSDSKEWKFLTKGKKSFSFLDGSPDIANDTVEIYAQQIHDLLIDKGFTYMHCFMILNIVQGTLKQERDIKKL